MYEFLGHPSEELIQVTASTAEEVFVDSAKALFELMTDTGKIRNDVTFGVKLSGPDRLLLLVDWLNRLILIHEAENVFLTDFQVKVESNNMEPECPCTRSNN